MPSMFKGKKKVFKKKKKVRKARKAKKYMANSQMVMYHGSNNLPVPPRYRTKMISEAYGYIANGVSNDTFAVFANSAYRPWDVSTAAPVTGTNFPNFQGGLVSANLDPIGYVTLTSSMYNTVRIFAAKLEVDILPVGSVPIIFTITPSTSPVVPTNPATAQGQPFTKRMIVEATKELNHKSTCSCYISMAKFNGVSSRAVTDDLSGKFEHNEVARPASGNQLYFVINYETMDGSITTNRLEWRAKVTYYVEFFNNNSANLSI